MRLKGGRFQSVNRIAYLTLNFPKILTVKILGKSWGIRVYKRISGDTQIAGAQIAWVWGMIFLTYPIDFGIDFWH